VIRQRSLTVRLTALFALASTAVLVGLGLLIISTVAKHFTDQDEQTAGKKELQLIRMVVNERGADAITSTFGEALHNHSGLLRSHQLTEWTGLVFDTGQCCRADARCCRVCRTWTFLCGRCG